MLGDEPCNVYTGGVWSSHRRSVEPRTQRVVLIIADISGYTRFMVANQVALVHAQTVITKLLEGIIREVEIPLEVKEIEGDAVFLYVIKPDDETAWEETRRLIGRKLLRFFETFARGIVSGSEFMLCSCPSCQNIDKLKLKIVVHSGEALFHQVGRFSNLSGVDVILAHRLLKNSVPGDEYVLMTESAYRDIEFPTSIDVTRGEEHYEGFDSILTYTYLTYTYLAEGASAPEPEAVERLYANRGRAFATGLRMLARGYFGQFPILLGLRQGRSYGDLDELPVSHAARAIIALRLFLLAPLLLPLGASVQAYRALTRSARSTRAHRV
jgi:class 3 adenylate cyclase